MRGSRLLSLTLPAGLFGAHPARADYLFSDSGESGSLTGVAEQEVWTFSFSGGLGNWGRLGIGEGTTAYTRPEAAFGIDITFTGGGTISLNPTPQRSVFIAAIPSNPWEVSSLDGSSISSRASRPEEYLDTGDRYCVNLTAMSDRAPARKGVPRPFR